LDPLSFIVGLVKEAAQAIFRSSKSRKRWEAWRKRFNVFTVDHGGERIYLVWDGFLDDVPETAAPRIVTADF